MQKERKIGKKYTFWSSPQNVPFFDDLAENDILKIHHYYKNIELAEFKGVKTVYLTNKHEVRLNRGLMKKIEKTASLFLMSQTHRYPHFNPDKYDIHVKIASVRTSAHSKHNINYHLVWIPKYRKIVLRGGVKEVLRDIIEGNCMDLHLEMLALEIMPDHIHLFVGARPTHRPCDIVKQLKGNTSIQLRRCFPYLKYLGYQKHYKKFPSLWARGYYCGSAGHVSQDSVKKYILEQNGKDVFEYNIYGCPEGMDVRIGNFTQSKLEVN